ncbi:MAG: DNA-binding protein [Bacteroidetes bacterium GWF2_43_63]|nr:MAG: DNA-binding protein [Bacteroidetes bacterium GWE2_42_42]OFY54061.1 MAG: DNA-binding protein [Bacteroidetes bacterium GWF2_43_63]HCB63526.1 DNA-binding protein [Bacteroidales bacterium]HCY23228.1 DNA-binding protein [Bacteroidales bacterium]
MENAMEIIQINEIENRIFSIRGEQTMIDRDLAELYQISTKVLNQSVKRNLNRFPPQWRFQLTDYELTELVTNCDRLSILKHSASNPYAFTEQGVAMLATVLRSEIAAQVSILIISAFVEMRKFLISNKTILSRVSVLEQKQSETDLKIEKVFSAMESGSVTPKQGIFFEGQIFDAWAFVSDLIQSAEKSIELWDHYVDASVLMLLSKRRHDTIARIYLKKVSAALQTDIDKYNSQYPPVEINISSSAHDRFLLIDNKRLYHIGASLKDLGKRCFAFSMLDAKLAKTFIQHLRCAKEN